MSRLGYARKFALLWLVFLVAISVVVSSLYVSLTKEIRNSQRELDGIRLATPVSRAVQVLQQHRGLSAGFLEGSKEMQVLRAVKEKDVADTFAVLGRILPQNLRDREDWHDIKANWLRLRREGL